MKIRSALSTEGDSCAAAEAVCQAVAGVTPDLAALWVSPHHGPDYDEVATRVCDRLNPRNLIGCSAESVIGPDREVESAPAVALWVASLPGARVLPFVLDQNDLMNMSSAADWHDRLGVSPESIPTFIIVPDPFSVQFDDCLKFMDEAFPGSTISGGVASAGRSPGENRLFLNDQVLRQGLVGVSLTGEVRVSTVVSQGCRPVGGTYVVTKTESNVIYELGGRSALAVLKDVHAHAGAGDQKLMSLGVHVGRAIDENLPSFGVGDFLIRNIAGVVENKGLAVTDCFRAGQTVQFHVRDAQSAEAEMRSLLSTRLRKMAKPPIGGLLFNCNGRGTNLFDRPHHDISIINEMIRACPMAGFFAAGEIGPVGGRTFVHGFTSSLILFHEP